MTIWEDLAYVAPATKALSVVNAARRQGLTTSTAIHEFLRDNSLADEGPHSEPMPLSWITDGIAYLVANGFATVNGPDITFTNIDPDGKPSQLRRVTGNEFALELAS